MLRVAIFSCSVDRAGSAGAMPLGMLGIFDRGPAKHNSDLDILASLVNDEPSGRVSCVDPMLQNISYPMPEHFPFPPIRLVMERIPHTCDLYRDRNFCKRFSNGVEFEPEYHVREVFASFLTGCHLRSCMTLDLGANNGWFTAYALSLGSYVVAVEPQDDLAKAIAQTIQLNCWAGRAVVLNAYAGQVSENLWRASVPRRWKVSTAPVVALEKLLLGQKVFELIKMDADGPEGLWMQIVDKLLFEKQVDIKTIVVECHDCAAEMVCRFQQQHGYDVYLLNMCVGLRFLDSKGIDVYGAFAKQALPSILEEMYSIRFMRHIYHFKPNMTVENVKECFNLTHPLPNQYVFTKVPLLEPRLAHPTAGVTEEAIMYANRAEVAEESGQSSSGARCWRFVTASVGALRMVDILESIMRDMHVNFGVLFRRCGNPDGTVACACIDEPCILTEDTCWSDYCDVQSGPCLAVSNLQKKFAQGDG